MSKTKGMMWRCNHIPDLRQRDFVNAEKQQVSVCKKCGSLLYREYGKENWYRPKYNKVKVSIMRKGDKVKLNSDGVVYFPNIDLQGEIYYVHKFEQNREIVYIKPVSGKLANKYGVLSRPARYEWLERVK